MLFITVFALAFKPWEIHELEMAVLEMIDILKEIVREKKDKFELETKGKVGKNQSEQRFKMLTNHINVY